MSNINRCSTCNKKSRDTYCYNCRKTYFNKNSKVCKWCKKKSFLIGETDACKQCYLYVLDKCKNCNSLNRKKDYKDKKFPLCNNCKDVDVKTCQSCNQKYISSESENCTECLDSMKNCLSCNEEFVSRNYYDNCSTCRTDKKCNECNTTVVVKSEYEIYLRKKYRKECNWIVYCKECVYIENQNKCYACTNNFKVLRYNKNNETLCELCKTYHKVIHIKNYDSEHVHKNLDLKITYEKEKVSDDDYHSDGGCDINYSDFETKEEIEFYPVIKGFKNKHTTRDNKVIFESYNHGKDTPLYLYYKNGYRITNAIVIRAKIDLGE